MGQMGSFGSDFAFRTDIVKEDVLFWLSESKTQLLSQLLMVDILQTLVNADR